MSVPILECNDTKGKPRFVGGVLELTKEHCQRPHKLIVTIPAMDEAGGVGIRIVAIL